MLALAWPWDEARHDRTNALAKRLAASLCAGIGGHASAVEVEGVHFAYRPLRSTSSQVRAWRPARLADGRVVAFHGYFDNAAEIAKALDTNPGDLASLYGLAVDRWGDDADRKIIGEYCAIIATLEKKLLRLSRSPIRAPPLCYFHDAALTVVASVPRALFATGIEQKLNYRRVADSALLNFTDPEVSWFENVFRMPGGSIVELRPGKPRVLRRYYDLLAVPKVHMASDADYMTRASELLDEGVRACIAGFRKPGVTLSGGLDSPQIAVRTLAALPDGQRLPTFTFHPEDGYDGLVESWMFGDERPFVEAFAAMHPRLESHFTANEGYGHDYRWNDFFHLMGGAPSGLCTMYVFHGLFAGAVRESCDVLLLAQWGNDTLSNHAPWSYVEFLVTGRWRQLWRALKNLPGYRPSMAWRFAAMCLMPLLPTPLWRLVRQIVLGKGSWLEQVQPLSSQYRAESGAEQRRKDSGINLERFEPRSRKHGFRLLLERGDFEDDERLQAFEQMYGVAQRDPMAYRPFVEFCWGLPTNMFMRDGEPRWLARQMSKGIMPEAQRLNRLNGRWNSDWHLRIGRRRPDLLAELDRLESDPRIASMLDLPRLRIALEDWPAHTKTDRHKSLAHELAVPFGLLTARFINYVEGRNE